MIVNIEIAYTESDCFSRIVELVKKISDTCYGSDKIDVEIRFNPELKEVEA